MIYNLSIDQIPLKIIYSCSFDADFNSVPPNETPGNSMM